MRRSWYQYRNPSTRQLPPSTNQTLRAVPDVWGNTTIDPFAPSVQGEKQGKVDYAKISGGSGSTSTLIRTHTSNARHQTPGFRQLGRAFGWMRSSN
ncbi:hypothetical protein LX36DRAFT_654479 [Colletotrichum falcatum]|nr:hypothetical protein LX36DRAFT_654479 [Colletotrichum falcatum]